jgi:hypothetical protein
MTDHAMVASKCDTFREIELFVGAGGGGGGARLARDSQVAMTRNKNKTSFGNVQCKMSSGKAKNLSYLPILRPLPLSLTVIKTV